jgi:hypothetical protein
MRFFSLSLVISTLITTACGQDPTTEVDFAESNVAQGAVTAQSESGGFTCDCSDRENTFPQAPTKDDYCAYQMPHKPYVHELLTPPCDVNCDYSSPGDRFYDEQEFQDLKATYDSDVKTIQEGMVIDVQSRVEACEELFDNCSSGFGFDTVEDSLEELWEYAINGSCNSAATKFYVGLGDYVVGATLGFASLGISVWAATILSASATLQASMSDPTALAQSFLLGEIPGVPGAIVSALVGAYQLGGDATDRCESALTNLANIRARMNDCMHRNGSGFGPGTLALEVMLIGEAAHEAQDELWLNAYNQKEQMCQLCPYVHIPVGGVIPPPAPPEPSAPCGNVIHGTPTPLPGGGHSSEYYCSEISGCPANQQCTPLTMRGEQTCQCVTASEYPLSGEGDEDEGN